jgi:RNA polymerase-binding transcription factor DksA
MADAIRLREAITAARHSNAEQIAGLERSLADIIQATQLTSTDDEHDPEGATIAYERAQVSALLSQARIDGVDLEAAAERVDNGTITTCAMCGGSIAMERLLAVPTVRACIRCAAG